MARPDILLLITDQQRFDELGVTSGGGCETPNLDRLARAGALFENAYACSTICQPARASILTGTFTHRLPFTDAPAALVPGAWTFVRALRSAGYQTALFGKGHFNPIRADHGFDLMRVAEGLGKFAAGDDDYCRWYSTKYGVDPREESLARASANPPNFGAFTFSGPPEDHVTSWITREAMQFLEHGRDPERPCLTVVSYPRPHAPFDPPPPYDHLYDEADAQPELDLRIDTLPAAMRPLFHEPRFGMLTVRTAGLEAARRVLTYRKALIRQIDDSIGALLELVDPSRTLILFTSDHGDYGGRRGLLMKAPALPYDDLARVPLIASGLDVPPGLRVSDVVQTADIALTCLCASEAAWETCPPVDCGWLQYYWLGGRSDSRSVFTSSIEGYHGIRRRGLKFFRHPRRNIEVLFDLQSDPSEVNNLAQDPRWRSECAVLREELRIALECPTGWFAFHKRP